MLSNDKFNIVTALLWRCFQALGLHMTEIRGLVLLTIRQWRPRLLTSYCLCFSPLVLICSRSTQPISQFCLRFSQIRLLSFQFPVSLPFSTSILFVLFPLLHPFLSPLLSSALLTFTPVHSTPIHSTLFHLHSLRSTPIHPSWNLSALPSVFSPPASFLDYLGCPLLLLSQAVQQRLPFDDEDRHMRLSWIIQEFAFESGLTLWMVRERWVKKLWSRPRKLYHKVQMVCLSRYSIKRTRKQMKWMRCSHEPA